jgi:nucleoside-diphosphate-sugar epimerase
MRVFVAGASGAVGPPLLRQLVAAGHEVTGMTRYEDKAAAIREAGAEAAVCDAFDAERLREVVAAAAPEAVVHALTALPPKFNPRSDYLAPTNRIRIEGTQNLVAAAQAAGARRLVAESVCFFYRPDGGWVKDEEAPLNEDAPGHFGAAIEAIVALERQVLAADDLEGVVLRYGWFYGPRTYYAPGGAAAEDVGKRRYPVVGDGTGTFSFLHVEDAASATVAALDHGPPGVYNVADDHPARLSEWLPVYAAAIGAKPPRRVPAWLARVGAGEAVTEAALEMRGASNTKAKRELGWEPRHPNWREGFRDALS